MNIESTRLGKLDVSEENVFTFPKGIPGFLDETTFAYIPHGENSPFAFYQSLTEPNLTFLTVDPFAFFSDYQFELDDDTVGELGLSDSSPLKVHCIVTVPENAEEMTANLLAPIIVNVLKRQARQIVLDNMPFTTKHRLFPQGFPKKNEDKGGK